MMASSQPAVVARVDRDNPWPGLASYDEYSHEYFSGRATETADLLRRIVDEPVTVLFGKSGLGKSSLLKAGVFPGLREKDLLPVFIRLQVRAGAEPLMEQVRLALFDEFRSHAIEHPLAMPDETLWEYLHRPGLEFWTPHNRLVRPVFVFDQFEELFTLGRAMREDVATFRDDLADLAENRIPASVCPRLDSGVGGGRGLDVHAMPFKLVLSLREDYLPELEGWHLAMPSLKRNRMRLLPMGPRNALQAVFNERTQHLVTQPLARRIVEFLATGAARWDDATLDEEAGLIVEPALLSLFCRGINENRRREHKTRFDEALLEGGKKAIVADFCDSSLSDQPARVRRFIEDELVTEQGFRNSFSVVAAVESGLVTDKELQTLVNRRLLRLEQHLGTERVELTHDLLTRAVLDGREARLRAERAQRERRQRWKMIGVGGVLACIAIVFAGLAANANRLAVDANHMRSLAQDNVDKLEVANRELAATTQKAEQATRAANEAKEKISQAYVAVAEASNRTSEQAEIARLERQRADAERDRARSRELAAQARAKRDNDAELAVLLALEGIRQADTLEARSALLDAARFVWPLAILAKEMVGAQPRAIAMSHDGSRLAVLAGDRLITMWDITRRQPVRAWAQPASVEQASALAFGPDLKTIAVGRDGAIDVLDAATGRIQQTLVLPERADRQSGVQQIAISPDGTRLAATQNRDSILVHDATQAQAHWSSVRIEKRDLGSFTFSTDGQQIVGVSLEPMSAFTAQRQPEGHWELASVDLSECGSPQSISPSSNYISMTSTAKSCIASLTGKGVDADDLELAISDIVSSPQGGAFVEVLATGDLLVGTGRPAGDGGASQIKGAKPMEANNRTALLSVSETGSRIALVDTDERVRVYSLAGDKLLLGQYPAGSSAVAPDQRWVAFARRSRPGANEAAIDVIAIDEALSTGELPRPRARIDLPGLPKSIQATPDSVRAMLSSPRASPARSLWYDAVTGLPRGEPLGVVASANVTRPRDLVPVPPAAGRDDVLVGQSPGGKFDLRRRRDAQGTSQYVLVRRADNSIVKQGAKLGSHRFSESGRWMAYWDSQSIEVVDLARGEAAVDIDVSHEVRAVEFAGGDSILRVVFWNDSSTLVPLEREMMQKFARWLMPRQLTGSERCESGLGGAECRKYAIESKARPIGDKQSRKRTEPRETP